MTERGFRLRPATAILLGAVTVGVLDGLDAVIFFGLRSGASPVRIFQGIASGLLGPAAFEGGIGTAFLGAALQFFIAFGIVTTFYVASRAMPTLARRPLVFGPLYRIAVYLVMTRVVVPLSAAASRGGLPPTPVLINGLLIHMLGVGLPAALFTHWALPRLARR
jgi:hypothetical protein